MFPLPDQLVLLGPTAHIQIVLIPVCHVQLTQPQVELLLQFAPALEDITELHRRVQILAALVSQITYNTTRMLIQGGMERRGKGGRKEGRRSEGG